MDTAREIESLKQRLNELVKRQANPQPRPQLRRAKVVAVGAYNCHQIEFIDGKFTKGLTTDDLSNQDRGEKAYVGDDFNRIIRQGDKVFVSLCEGRFWIVAKDDQACIGYCIDDPQDTAYVWGFYFLGPDLGDCCPEAGGPQLLTTSDGGSTYESATFQCNETGDNRKWIWNGTKLYISPMLDAGNVQYQTDQTVENCSIVLQKYEGLIFPIQQCGPIPDSVCLHPLCGTPGCDDCDHGTPLIYEASHGGNLSQDPDAISPPPCILASPILFYFDHNLLGSCAYETNQKSIGPYNLNLLPYDTPPQIYTSGGGSVVWQMPGGSTFDYYGENVFTLITDVSSHACVGWPETITVRPRLDTIVEANCNPLIWRVITDDGFAASSVDDVVCWQLPRWWAVEISGVTNDVCSDCDVFNGVHLLDFFNQVIAESDDITTTCASGSPFTFRFSWGLDSGTWYLYLLVYYGPTTSDVYATYRKTLGSDAHGINCVGANVLDLISNSSECQTWPSTVTVRPLV